MNDDLKPFFKLIRNSATLISGSPVHAGNVTGWMFSFLTRIRCFHHVGNLLTDKPVPLVVTGLFQRTCERKVTEFVRLFRRKGHLGKIIGYICYISKPPSCCKCGMGRKCGIGGLWAMMERNEEKLKNWKPTRDMFKRWGRRP